MIATYARHHKDTNRVLNVKFSRYAGTQKTFPVAFYLFGPLVFATVIVEAPINNRFHHQGGSTQALPSADAEVCTDTGGCSETGVCSGTEVCWTESCWEDMISSMYSFTTGRSFVTTSDSKENSISLIVALKK